MLNWGLLGTSFVSGIVADAIKLSPDSRIVAAGGRDAGRLSAFCAMQGIDKSYRDFDALLDDPQIEAVYIGLPNNVHHVYAIKAAAKGKAVLSEKSLTTTMPDAEALAAAVRMHGTFFVEGLMYLAHPLFRCLVEFIESGRLGTIKAVDGFYAADIAGVVNPLGNGTIYDLGCYPVSLLHLVVQTAFGPDAFRARTSAGFGNLGAHGTIAEAVLNVRFGNGLLASLHSSSTMGMAHGFTILGQHGALIFRTNPWLPAAGDNVLEWRPHEGAPETIVVDDPHDAFYHQVRMIERALRAGVIEVPRPSPRLAESLEIMELLTDWEAHCRAGLQSTSGTTE